MSGAGGGLDAAGVAHRRVERERRRSRASRRWCSVLTRAKCVVALAQAVPDVAVQRRAEAAGADERARREAVVVDAQVEILRARPRRRPEEDDARPSPATVPRHSATMMPGPSAASAGGGAVAARASASAWACVVSVAASASAWRARKMSKLPACVGGRCEREQQRPRRRRRRRARLRRADFNWVGPPCLRPARSS